MRVEALRDLSAALCVDHDGIMHGNASGDAVASPQRIAFGDRDWVVLVECPHGQVGLRRFEAHRDAYSARSQHLLFARSSVARDGPRRGPGTPPRGVDDPNQGDRST